MVRIGYILVGIGMLILIWSVRWSMFFSGNSILVVVLLSIVVIGMIAAGIVLLFKKS